MQEPSLRGTLARMTHPRLQMLLASATMLAFAAPADGQPMPMDHAQHDMAVHEEAPLGLTSARDGSGTSWLPDDSPPSGGMRTFGPWMVMLHGNGFVQFIDAGSDRGDRQFGSINWIMGMAQRRLAGGQVTVRTMFSADPATVGRCGYPNLLQTGEFCDDERLHDRQHPHDVFMELAVSYRRAITPSLAIEIYGGPSGDPALGPTAYPHRPSAMPNPLSPIAHHWLDASHISFGVVTGAIYGRRWKAEGSIFNGREPDDRRGNVDVDALDSYAGRFWIMPTPRWAIQVSTARLTDAEIDEPGNTSDLQRVTASATYHRRADDRLWATTLAAGWNREAHHQSAAAIAETAIDVTRLDTVFARGELVSKTASDLALPFADHESSFTISKWTTGYTRWLSSMWGIKPGVGGTMGLAVLPASLASYYGGRTVGEFSVFLTLRPR
jgi:hypothetical protein